MSCTTLLVGKNASYDGSTMIARNDDSGADGFTPKKFVVISSKEQKRKYKTVISHLEIDLPDNPMSYTAMPNAVKGKGIWAASGINEENIAMTATETITSNPRVLGADPLVEYDEINHISGGIGEEDIVYIVLPYIHSAREGVERLGSLLEKYGTYEMNGIAFQDHDEIWWLETLGGHQWCTADGENCTVHTRDGKVYTGVVLNKEPSAHVADQKVEATEENMEILLDENVSTEKDVKVLGIQVGDIIAMDPRTVVTPSGYIKSRFLDDKLSAAILLGIAKEVAEKTITLHRKVSLLFTVYEEVGHGGSSIPADTEEMICVDMGCVGDDLGCTERMVSICAKDSGGPYNYDLVTELSELAKANGLDYAIDVYPHYGSDVEASLRGGFDIRHGLIGPGVYASHNYERSHIDGVRNTVALLKAYLGK